MNNINEDQRYDGEVCGKIINSTIQASSCEL